jgi:hypothetical protein
MAETITIALGLGLLAILVGYLQIQNVRNAIRTGVIAVSIRDTGRNRSYKRDENPLAYHLNFWPSLFAAIVLPIMGIGSIGFAVFLWANP